jgi:hypothetical protein
VHESHAAQHARTAPFLRVLVVLVCLVCYSRFPSETLIQGQNDLRRCQEYDNGGLMRERGEEWISV